MVQSDSSLLLQKTLTRFVHNLLRAFVIVDGKVTDVNDDFTCDITVQDVAYTSVPIMVLTGVQASNYPVPVVGTTCLVTFRDGNRGLPQIVAFDQIDTWKINCKTLVEFNGGSNGGMPLSPKLKDQLNKIENQQNQILSILKGINIASTPFSFTPLFTSINPLTPTTQQQIENTKIKQ
jgi:hypothetical protein